MTQAAAPAQADPRAFAATLKERLQQGQAQLVAAFEADGNARRLIAGRARLVDAIGSGTYDFIVVNYANPDMVGHTGVWDAAVQAAEVVDGCLARVADATLAAGGALLITADHGNIEEMRDEAGKPQTKHTTSPVPMVLVNEANRGSRLRDGRLADVAPTICQLMGIEPGPEMTGRSLIG